MIPHRLLLAIGILASVMVGSLPAIAADWKAFSQAEFSAAQEAGRALKAQRQSTLITFKGAEEMARSVGDTDPATIEAMLKTAL